MAPCFGLFSSQCPHLASLLFPSRINSRWHEPVRTLKERTPGFNTSRYYSSKLLKQWFKGERSNIFQLMRKLCMEINWKECAFVWRISLSNSLPVCRYITPRPHQLSRLCVYCWLLTVQLSIKPLSYDFASAKRNANYLRFSLTFLSCERSKH